MALKPRAVRRLASMQEVWIHVAGSVLISKLRIDIQPIDRGPRYAGQSKMNFVGLALHGFKGLMVFAEDVLVRVGIVCAFVAVLSVLGSFAAIVLKVGALHRLAGNESDANSRVEYQAGIDTILASLEQLPVPGRLRSVHKLITASIGQQSDYFNDWALRSAAGEHFSFSIADNRVAAVHRDLITAYNLLIRLYPQAGRVNRSAFYNNLCALDFI